MGSWGREEDFGIQPACNERNENAMSHVPLLQWAAYMGGGYGACMATCAPPAVGSSIAHASCATPAVGSSIAHASCATPAVVWWGPVEDRRGRVSQDGGANRGSQLGHELAVPTPPATTCRN